MTTETRWQSGVCEQLSKALSAEPAVRALWLSGSLARGDADDLSDIDLVAVVAGASLADAATNIETRLATDFDLVLQRNRGDDNFRLLNLVTADWQRFDVSLFSLEAVRRSNLSGLQLLFDKDNLNLPITSGEPPKTSVTDEQVSYVVTEFVRVLGLLPVVMRRHDLIGAASGSGLLRELLITLLKYEQPEQTMRGALNETSTLSPAAAAAILGLPALRAEESSILKFNQACWAIFDRFAPAITRQYGIAWPTTLIQALRRRLTRELDLTLY